MADINMFGHALGSALNYDGERAPLLHHQVTPQYSPPTPGDVTFPRLHGLIHDLHDFSMLNMRKNVLLLYIFLIVVYIGINLALLSVNFKSQEFIEANYFLPMHLLEFWAVFCFTTSEAFILIFTDTISFRNKLQSLLAFGNIMGTLITAIMFSMDPEVFETPAHWLEYCLQILITCVNFIFIVSYMRKRDTESTFYRFRWIELTIACLVFILSVLQLCIYGGWIRTPLDAEQAAHFSEYTTEAINGVFALIFASVTYTDFSKKANDQYALMRKVV